MTSNETIHVHVLGTLEQLLSVLWSLRKEGLVEEMFLELCLERLV